MRFSAPPVEGVEASFELPQPSILLVPSEPIAKIITGIIFRLVISKFIRLQRREAAMGQFPNGSIFQKFPTKRSDPRMENETQPR
jgi:hypothetical protein